MATIGERWTTVVTDLAGQHGHAVGERCGRCSKSRRRAYRMLMDEVRRAASRNGAYPLPPAWPVLMLVSAVISHTVAGALGILPDWSVADFAVVLVFVGWAERVLLWAWGLR